MDVCWVRVGIEQVWAALVVSYPSNWRHFCPGWADTLAFALGAWPSCHMTRPPDDLPSIHLSEWSSFTPQSLGSFSFSIGAKQQWTYRKQLTEPYLSSLILCSKFCVWSSLPYFFPLCYHGLRLWFINSDNFLWVPTSFFLSFFVCLANCYLLTENDFSKLYFSNSRLQAPEKANEHWCLDCSTRHLPQS